ncbi:MAG: response regulator [Bacteroides sp.]|nr:response regulator [Bacteroides sp.]MBD5330231.1 response regulator [Bacteroides sp.]
MASSLKYIILEDSYFIATDIKNSIAGLCPHTECTATVEAMEDCIHMANNQDVDLIIMDMESAGENAVSKIRQSRISHPLILISDNKDIRQSLSGLNMIEFILKPVTASALSSAFRKYEESIC